MKQLKNHSGFTLIEMLVVISIVAISVPIVVTLFSAVMRQQIQTNKLTQTKNQASSALNTIKTLIRNNAYTLHSAYPATDANMICNSQSTIQTPAQLVFRDAYDKSFYFQLSPTGEIASISSQLSIPTLLTTSPVVMSDFTASCSRPSFFAAPIVYISLTAAHTDTRLGATTLPFQTRMRLRNR